jgi:enoyl-CoA hydratase
MQFENIIYKKEEGIARLIVNRQEKMNALNYKTRVEMDKALEDVKTDSSVKVLIISGAGKKSFIAGADLNELALLTPLKFEEFASTVGQRFFSKFEEIDKPVIAMIDGLCFGGGLEVALACDIRLASDSSKFGQPEINVGIIPGGGGTQRLSRLIGVGKAKELIFTGTIIDAKEAYRIGLINQIVPSEQLEEFVTSMAEKIVEKSPLAIKWAKKSINNSTETTLNAGLAYEVLVESLLFSSKDKEEGIKAFFEKRKPEFKGE